MRRQGRARRKAATAVETAVISLVCFVFMFGLFEFGRVISERQLLDNAARQGVRAAVVIPTSYQSGTAATTPVMNAVVAGLAVQNPTVTLTQNGAKWVGTVTTTDQTLKNITITIWSIDANNNVVAWTSAPFGQNIIIQVDADYPNLFPTMGWLPNSGAAPNSVHLTASVMMRGEAN
jgi:Flp pilus assembly protein TadG